MTTVRSPFDNVQRMNEKPLKPWIVAEQDGKILAGNCDCMAGLGETCSHVASLLWATATGVEKRNTLTVTQKSAYWVIPPAIKKVPYAPMSDIDFVGKKRKCRSIDDNADIPSLLFPSNKCMTKYYLCECAQCISS